MLNIHSAKYKLCQVLQKLRISVEKVWAASVQLWRNINVRTKILSESIQ